MYKKLRYRMYVFPQLFSSSKNYTLIADFTSSLLSYFFPQSYIFKSTKREKPKKIVTN